MKQLFLNISFALILILIVNTTNAQEKQKAKVFEIKKNGQTIELTISSPKAFYIGSNAHILYINQYKIELNKQHNFGKKGFITFYITEAIFNLIKDKSSIWMTYGEIVEPDATNQQFETLLVENPFNCWSVGILNKKKLK
jgi:hypothetical protein